MYIIVYAFKSVNITAKKQKMRIVSKIDSNSPIWRYIFRGIWIPLNDLNRIKTKNRGFHEHFGLFDVNEHEITSWKFVSCKIKTFGFNF